MWASAQHHPLIQWKCRRMGFPDVLPRDKASMCEYLADFVVMRPFVHSFALPPVDIVEARDCAVSYSSYFHKRECLDCYNLNVQCTVTATFPSFLRIVLYTCLF